MAGISTSYADEVSQFYYDVTYIVNATGAKLKRSFESEYMARKFVNKLRHSRKCTLVSCPLFH